MICCGYRRPDVLEVLKKHEAYLLVNIANEAGSSSPPDMEYRAAYELAVRRMETKFGVGLVTAVPKVPIIFTKVPEVERLFQVPITFL